MKKVKAICVFILAIGIIIFGLVQIASSTILSKNYMLSKLEENNYYINTYTQVRDDFENYIYQSGLNKEVIDGIISVEDIKRDTNIIISNIYDGIYKEIDVTKLKEKLNNNIDESLKGSNLPLSTKGAIEKFVDKIASQYEETILHTNFENTIYEEIQKVQKFMRLAKTISILMIGVPAIIILAINNKKYWRSIASIGIPFVSSGLFYEFVDIYINSKVKIANITILNNAITFSLRNILLDIFNKLRNIGFVFLGLGISLIIIGNFVREKKHSKHKKTE